MPATDIAYAQDAMLAFASHAESCVVTADAANVRSLNPATPTADAFASCEVSKLFDQAYLPIGRIVVGFLSGKVASASFEPASPLAVSLLGADRTDDAYPLVAEQMLALREAFSPWPRDPAVVLLDTTFSLADKLQAKRGPATHDAPQSSALRKAAP